MKLVVIGGGNMGLTYAKGIHQAGLLTEKISILETGDVFTQLVKTEPDFDIYDNAEDCIKNADILLIAVKPFQRSYYLATRTFKEDNQYFLLIIFWRTLRCYPETLTECLMQSRELMSCPWVPVH